MSAVIVETACGKVQGQQMEDLYVWKGIPYAKAPLGPLRFRPPQKPDAWTGIRDAAEFGPVAPQTSSVIMNYLGNDIENMNEDCLYLNIWSKGADDKKRPVMVWIHGGAFLSGSGSSSWYDGSSFASSGDVVVVTINYRLGILGFLHLGEIGGEEYASSGNCGILDQVAALQWIKENIAAFGGDPNRITVFGESAGAMSIGVLLGLPSAKGLFQQAILQSGAASNALPSSKATHIAKRLLNELNIDHDNLSKLEELPVQQLIKASTIVPSMSLGPVIDGVNLPQSPEEAISKGSAKDISIMLGTNKDEYRIFTFFDPLWKNPEPNKIMNIFQHTFKDLLPALLKEFNETQLNQDLFDQLMTIRIFTYPALQLAEQHVKQGSPLYMYRFDWESPVFNGGLKSSHAIEIPFVFNTINTPNTENLIGNSPNRQRLADTMHQAWISFAKNGNPSNSSLPEWPRYELEKRSTMILDNECKLEFDPNYQDCLRWREATKTSV